MSFDEVRPLLVGIGLTIASSVADSRGLLRASVSWYHGKTDWVSMAASFGWFMLGIGLYVAAVKFLTEFGTVAPEIQTTVWFVATVVAVALVSGEFSRWAVIDRFLAVAVLGGVGTLIVRTRQ